MYGSIIFALVFLVLSAQQACAYIDFGTGSYVLQILAASAIGGLFLIKNYLRRIKQFFFKKLLSDKGVAGDSEGPK